MALIWVKLGNLSKSNRAFWYSMKQQKFLALFAMAPLLAFALGANPENFAYGYQQSGLNEETKETFFFRGQLTQATENNPYGGEAVGDYFIQVNVNEVRVIANLDSSQSDGKAMVAWLVDFGGEPAIFLGIFEDNELTTSTPINEWVYEAIIALPSDWEESRLAITLISFK